MLHPAGMDPVYADESDGRNYYLFAIVNRHDQFDAKSEEQRDAMLEGIEREPVGIPELGFEAIPANADDKTVTKTKDGFRAEYKFNHVYVDDATDVAFSFVVSASGNSVVLTFAYYDVAYMKNYLKDMERIIQTIEPSSDSATSEIDYENNYCIMEYGYIPDFENGQPQDGNDYDPYEEDDDYLDW